MVSLTLAIPKELKEKMEQHPELNWSSVARDAIQKKLELMELLKKWNKMLANSTLTEEDAVMLGRKANKRLAKRWEKRMREQK